MIIIAIFLVNYFKKGSSYLSIPIFTIYSIYTIRYIISTKKFDENDVPPEVQILWLGYTSLIIL